ncbi:MAG: YaaA family protein [Bacteroidota bacterium]|nr:YaaA family protein [Bacteroidota bacterium]
MKVLISPTKTMSISSSIKCETSKPIFLDEANRINMALSKWSENDLKIKMKLSAKLTSSTLTNIRKWGLKNKHTGPSIFSYKGTAFKHMDTSLWSEQDLIFSQNSVLILSAYYGLLRPLDQIAPYRLEMGIAHQIIEGYKSMYEFWRKKITEYVNQLQSKIILNLASKEYSQVILTDQLHKKWINCDFYEMKTGTPKIVGNYAKAARGLMVNYIVKNKIKSVQELMNFNEGNYKLDEANSSELNLKFIR